MDTDKTAQIQAHAQAIAALLYEEADPEQVKTLAGIEEVVRKQVLEHVSSEIGIFLSQPVVVQRGDANELSIALLEN
jgi:hypothetical protein